MGRSDSDRRKPLMNLGGHPSDLTFVQWQVFDTTTHYS